MKTNDELRKIAVLVDAENASYNTLKVVLDEISTHGYIITKKAYGDWSSTSLKNWKTVLNELAIQPIQQFAYTKKRNATDGKMIIDAMDLLYSKKYNAFALISSDSDFTTLAMRLREDEMYVFGIGENKTPIPFRNACNDFILTELLTSSSEKTTATEDKIIISPEKDNVKNEIKLLLDSAYEKYKEDDNDDWAHVTSAAAYIKRAKPDFDLKIHGVEKFTELISIFETSYEQQKIKGNGTTLVNVYRKKT